jgi:hypothetical protein
MEKKIEEILKHQEFILSAIDKALEDELLSVSWEVENLKEKIINGLRWGLFLRPKVEEVPQLRTTTKLSKGSFHDDAPIVRINFQEILALEKSLADWGVKQFPIFSPKIDKSILKGEISVDLDYEDCKTETCVSADSPEGIKPEKLLEFYELRLTLPGVFEAFGLDEDYDIPKWQYDSFDAYEKWKWSVEAGRRDYYLQIGGHGAWIQGSYTDTYIAQVNNDIGDAGAVFINVSESKIEKFSAWVDMH